MLTAKSSVLGGLISALALAACSGLPSLAASRRNAGRMISTTLLVAGCALGITVLAGYWLGGAPSYIWSLPWNSPFGPPQIRLDAVAAFFLFPVFLIAGAGSIYGLGYWAQKNHPASGGRLTLFWGIMTAAMAMVVLAGQMVVFLSAWEIMAMAGYFLLVTDDSQPNVRRAAWIYLIAAHLAALSLIAMCVLLHGMTGTFALWPRRLPADPGGISVAVFLLALAGFGAKAGLAPMHFWLPDAHAAAPGHVSAFFSGVMLTMGVYGLMRVAAIFADPPLWWGGTFLTVGAGTALLAGIWAIAQTDFKRMMALSSIENMGIIAMALGLAEIGISTRSPVLAALGVCGALLHMLNHSLFKPLLFLCAGAVIHAVHRRGVEGLGGLARNMPRTFTVSLVGALAISGIPPLNGFVSEWIIFCAFMVAGSTSGPQATAALPLAVLALCGAATFAAYITWISLIFLGRSKTDSTATAHDPGRSMLAPMIVLAGLCVVLGTVPTALAEILNRAAGAWSPAGPLPDIRSIVPFHIFTVLGIVLLAGAAIVGIALRRHRSRRAMPAAVTTDLVPAFAAVETWNCGFSPRVGRAAYTGGSMLQMPTHWFRSVIRPRWLRPRIEGIFPLPAEARRESPDPLLDYLINPLAARISRTVDRFRRLHGGKSQIYILYMLLILLILTLSIFVTA